MKQRTMALSLTLEGMSVRSVQRLAGICRQTLADLVSVVGENCERFSKATVKGVEATDVQLDEIWSFVGMKEKTRAMRGAPPEFGDSGTWLAVERDTKLILAHQIGQRDAESCWSFLLKMKAAIGKGRFQVTSDGLSHYRNNVAANPCRVVAPIRHGRDCGNMYTNMQSIWKLALAKTFPTRKRTSAQN